MSSTYKELYTKWTPLRHLPIALFVLLVCTACGNEVRTTSVNTGSPNQSKVSSTPRPPSIEEEAKNATREYLEFSFTKCGDSYYSRMSNYDEQGILEYKSPSFVVSKVRPLSEADRLNGAVWAGQVDFKYSAYREYNQGWGAWQPYPGYMDLLFNVVKVNSQWRVESQQVPRFRLYQKVQCSKIPH